MTFLFITLAGIVVLLSNKFSGQSLQTQHAPSSYINSVDDIESTF